MPSAASVELRGAAQLRKTILAAADEIDDLRALHLEVANIVVQAARPMAPHRSGALASSIRGQGPKTGAVMRAGSRALPYARPIEFGWPARGIAPQPFMYPAREQTQPRWLARYVSRLREIVAHIRGA